MDQKFDGYPPKQDPNELDSVSSLFNLSCCPAFSYKAVLYTLSNRGSWCYSVTAVTDKVPPLSSVVEPERNLNYCKDIEPAEEERKSMTKKMYLMVTAAPLRNLPKGTTKNVTFLLLFFSVLTAQEMKSGMESIQHNLLLSSHSLLLSSKNTLEGEVHLNLTVSCFFYTYRWLTWF